MARVWKRELVERKRRNIKTVADLAIYLRELRMASIEDAIDVSLTTNEKRIFDCFSNEYTIDQIAQTCDASVNEVFYVVNKIAEIIETGRYHPNLRRVA